MADLTTTYLGLKLQNPFVVSSSGLTASIDGVRKAVQAGAGAVVLKSLFEEQLRSDISGISIAPEEGAHPEAEVFLEQMGIHGGAGEYLSLIRDSKALAGTTPIIASVNCVEGDLWVDFAEQIEIAGADALELNIAIFPPSSKISSKELEDRLIAIVRNVSVRTKLPIAVKIGPYYTNPAALVDRLAGAGAKGAILFNRFYRFDLDLDARGLKAGSARSGEAEYHESLRWIANLYGAVPCELIGGTGVHSAETALKFIAAGAHAVQVCSLLYKSGWTAIPTLISEMDKRLDALGIPSVCSFRGALSRLSSSQGENYERLQYIRALTGIA